MKILFLITLFFLTNSCFCQTQLELNQQADAAYKKADAELNKIYQQILTDYKTDKEFIKSLKAAQRIWISFRDAELKMKFPNTDTKTYGSVYPVCVNQYLEELTLARNKKLMEWIEGIEEGDVCTGSCKVK